MKLPKHECSLTLEHNAHRDYYESIDEYLSRIKQADCFLIPEHRSRSIATDSLWTMHWYPITPISFQCISSPTLDELLEWALEIDKDQEVK